MDLLGTKFFRLITGLGAVLFATNVGAQNLTQLERSSGFQANLVDG